MSLGSPGKSNSQVDLGKVQKSLLKSTFAPAFVLHLLIEDLSRPRCT